MYRFLTKHRSFWRWTLVIIITGVFAVINLPTTFAYNQRIDWLLLLPWVAGYFYGEKPAMYVGLVAGLIRDLLFARFFGVGMLLCLLTGLLATMFFSKQFNRHFYGFPLQYILLWFCKEVLLLGAGVLRLGLVGFSWNSYMQALIKSSPIDLFINFLAAMLLAIIVRRVIKPQPFQPVKEVDYASEVEVI